MPPKRAGRKTGFSFTDVLIVRLINALTIATFFQPDEYFQSLEPAWNLAFGSNSGAWLTWVCFAWHPQVLSLTRQEWHYQLRSSLHPMLFAVPYALIDHAARLLEPFGCSTALRSSMLLAAPAVLQGFIAALGDWFTYKLASRVYGQESLNAKVTVRLSPKPFVFFFFHYSLRNLLISYSS